jgi:hypothetical protein
MSLSATTPAVATACGRRQPPPRWAGWALLALLERLTARTIWTVTALLASLGGPLSRSGITAANRAVLVLPHLAVGAVLIPALRSTAASRAGRPA